MKLKTFLVWSIDHSQKGYKLQDDGETMKMIWCKLCAKHVKKIEADGRIKGRVQTEWRRAYVEGTSYVTKDSVTKHCSSLAHLIGMSCESLEMKTVGPSSSAEGCDNTATGSDSSIEREGPPKKQPRIDDVMRKQARDGYRKLLNTAYIMAVNGLPLSAFHTLVKVQKVNGVKLLQGVQDSKKAKEFVWYLADAIREKLAIILSSSRAYSVLSDGSQARKTGSEKELVFVRVVRGGIPVYYVLALQDIDEYGDATAEHVKTAIDDAFIQKIHCSEER
jgi:hypothetical protein